MSVAQWEHCFWEPSSSSQSWPLRTMIWSCLEMEHGYSRKEWTIVRGARFCLCRKLITRLCEVLSAAVELRVFARKPPNSRHRLCCLMENRSTQVDRRRFEMVLHPTLPLEGHRPREMREDSQRCREHSVLYLACLKSFSRSLGGSKCVCLSTVRPGRW